MSGSGEQVGIDPTTLALIEQLKTTGFFDQMRNLDANIRKIVTDLETLGGLATQRVQETENLAAHLLAVEAILAAILKIHPVDADAVQQAIREITADGASEAAESRAVQSVVENLLAKSENEGK
ncbi:MAG: hypothetical protein MI741_10355 [Rhodospirillales bacterium]|nr:hypothetical protein [Rhodospirillales bacterium]